MKPLIPALLSLAMLSGCADTPQAVPSFNYGRLALNQALTIPPNAATVRLQYGRVVASNAVQEHDPFCVFEIDTVAAGEQTVRPGHFAITRIGRSIETIAGLTTLRRVRAVFGDDSGGPSHLYYKTIFRLQDEAQPVRALTCMSNQLAPGIAIMRHLTPAEIRQALGGIITLEFPA
jgi:hypothetical protein